ncbi:MAG: sensor histidine kinase [Novosphingobium sp.]
MDVGLHVEGTAVAVNAWNDLELRRRLISGLIAILVVQVAYWFALVPLFMPQDNPYEQVEAYDYGAAEIASPGWDAVRNTKYEKTDLPWESCCTAGYRAFRAHFDLKTVPDEGLAVVPVVDSDNFDIRINGTLLFGEGRMILPNQTYHGLFRGTIRIPSALLKPGRNELVYTMSRGPGNPYFFVGDVNLGPYTAVKKHFADREYMLNDYSVISMTLAYFVAVLALIGWWRGGRSSYLFWLGLVALIWALRLNHDEAMDPPLRDLARTTFLTFCNTLLPIAWLNLANAWGGRQLRWITIGSLALFTLAFAVFAAILWTGWHQGNVTVDEFITVYGGALGLVSFAILARKALAAPADLRWELAIYVLVCTMFLRDAGHVFLSSNRNVLMELSVPVLLVALVVAFFARNVRLFQSSASLNALLQTQLSERTAELEAAHLREKGMVRAQAHQHERQRIMRDMHDGLGSQLMSMLLMARRGQSEPAVVAEGLQSVIDEMRLMIDSMDSVGESLATALTIFRDRVASRIEATGKHLVWDDQSGGQLPDYGPRDVLQIFRVMQEAVTNALKHSSGDTIAVRLSPSPEAGFALRITVTDNGAGLGAANPRGRGLANMTGRAQTVGGRCTISDAHPGVAVVLDLPAHGRREAEGP